MASTNAATRTLSIPEITSEILLYASSYVFPTFDKRNARFSGRRDCEWLAGLARTCGWLHSPAVDILWAELSGIAPLWSLLGILDRDGEYISSYVSLHLRSPPSWA